MFTKVLMVMRITALLRGEVWDVQVAVYNGHVPTNIGHCLQF